MSPLIWDLHAPHDEFVHAVMVGSRCRSCERPCFLPQHAQQAFLLTVELRHLRYFLAVADMENISRAATHKLHVSQPSLSRQIRDLEDELGVRLLERTAKSVSLTEAGRAFRLYSRSPTKTLTTYSRAEAGRLWHRFPKRPVKSSCGKVLAMRERGGC